MTDTADIDALRDEWEGVLREHGMRGDRCICGAWWTAADQFGSVDQFRRHLAGVIAARVYSPGVDQ